MDICIYIYIEMYIYIYIYIYIYKKGDTCAERIGWNEANEGT